jgi:hypothetical protein
MIRHKTTKKIITETVLKEIPDTFHIYHEIPVEDLMFKWWMTGRQEGLRLTDEGMIAFQLAEISHYDYEFKQEGQSWHSFVLEVNKKIKCPYYLGVNKTETKKLPYIRLYDSKIAMMIGLYGNLHGYLNSIKVRP